MLSDATGLTPNHIGLTQSVEQRGFTVIDMAHDGNDRCPWRQRARIVLVAQQANLDV